MGFRCFRGAAALVLFCAFSACPQGASLPDARAAVAPEREAEPLTPDALARLTDIGPLSPGPGQHIITLSPDGRKAAFQSLQADPVTNDYRLRMIVIDVLGNSAPITIDEGGEFIRQMVDGVGGARVATGNAAAIPIEWSREGAQIYFLKKMSGKTQIQRAEVNGSGSKTLTSELENVEDFTLSSDRRRLVYSVRHPDPMVESARLEERRRGFKYDSRFIPLFADGPDAIPIKPLVIKSVDISSGETTPPSDADLAYFEAYRRAKGGPLTATSWRGRFAVAASQHPTEVGGQEYIAVEGVAHESIRCSAPVCTGAFAMWWTRDGKRLRYMRRDGWGGSKTSIYDWTPGSGSPKLLYSTSDLLLDCQPIGVRMICAREQSEAPRHIVLLNPNSGGAQIVYNPNPNFGRYTLGHVERMYWRNDFGVETFGDLVYPVGYIVGRSYPLIIVQYISRGFLRGGVGDEFPIQAFANRGYAVLSVQRPDAKSLVENATTMKELEHRLLEDFKDRRSVLSSIEIGVRALIRRGIVDAKEVGITGLSDGSSTVQFAAINSRLFRAGSVSGCCWDQFQDAVVGPGAAQAYHEIGWPTLLDYDASFWSHMSLVENARRVTMPILMQESDDEFRVAVPSYTALRQAGQPVALFVFPGENHVKWQPAHRLAIYQRNLRWFDYWLKGIGTKDEWVNN